MDIIGTIEARMGNGEPFTYGALCGLTPGGAKDDGRAADKTIQRWRRKGWIEMHGRSGRVPLWRLTAAGRTLVSEPSQS